MDRWIAQTGMFGCQSLSKATSLPSNVSPARKTPFDWKRELITWSNGNITMKIAMRCSPDMDCRWEGDLEAVRCNRRDCRLLQGCEEGPRNRFTAEDAKKAGLLPAKPGSGWAKFPAEMLRARCISKAIRMLVRELLQGVYTPEEVADFAATAQHPLPPLRRARRSM